MDRIEALYEAARPGVDLIMNYGPSGALQKQIEQGAPAALFLSAAEYQMEMLQEAGLVEERTDLLGNSLVVVGAAPLDALAALASPQIRTVAIGDPETVPAGAYAAEAIQQAGLWDALEPKLVYAKDVRHVTTYVSTGNADAGFVYRTDALDAGLEAALEVPAQLHAAIRYPAALLAGSARTGEARRFYEYLTTDEAAADIFEAEGFRIIRP